MIRSLRYRAIAESPLCVALQREDDAEPVLGGELLDISITGVRLAVASTFRFGERFLLHLESADVGLSTKVACCVEWIRFGETETECTLGCSFESDLERKVLEELVERAVLERRVSDRQQVSIDIRAKWDRISEEEETELRDVSSGGFCISSEHAVEIGTGVSIQLNPEEGDLTLHGTVTWCSTFGKETIVGGKWKDRKGTDWFRQRIASTELERSSKAKSRWRRSRLATTVALPIVSFVLGLQIGAHQTEIGHWLKSTINRMQQTAALDGSDDAPTSLPGHVLEPDLIGD